MNKALLLCTPLVSPRASDNNPVLKRLGATLKSVNMCNSVPREVKLSRSWRITLHCNEHRKAGMVQLNLSYPQTLAPPWTYYTQLHHPSSFSPLRGCRFSRAGRSLQYIHLYNTSVSTVVNFFPLSHSPVLSSGVPSGCPEHMCFGLPRVKLYLSPGWEQTVGFVCGIINQLSFNKNRKPDERQREETWGVDPCLGT